MTFTAFCKLSEIHPQVKGRGGDFLILSTQNLLEIGIFIVNVE
jgi:hypothetical protein